MSEQCEQTNGYQSAFINGHFRRMMVNQLPSGNDVHTLRKGGSHAKGRDAGRGPSIHRS
jgi:hypothetical protein